MKKWPKLATLLLKSISIFPKNEQANDPENQNICSKLFYFLKLLGWNDIFRQKDFQNFQPSEEKIQKSLKLTQTTGPLPSNSALGR